MHSLYLDASLKSWRYGRTRRANGQWYHIALQPLCSILQIPRSNPLWPPLTESSHLASANGAVVANDLRLNQISGLICSKTLGSPQHLPALQETCSNSWKCEWDCKGSVLFALLLAEQAQGQRGFLSDSIEHHQAVAKHTSLLSSGAYTYALSGQCSRQPL